MVIVVEHRLHRIFTVFPAYWSPTEYFVPQTSQENFMGFETAQVRDGWAMKKTQTIA
jgi:hypothetical protein